MWPTDAEPRKQEQSRGGKNAVFFPLEREDFHFLSKTMQKEKINQQIT
jgi:hypothetical protein